jgi:hypothetical protein
LDPFGNSILARGLKQFDYEATKPCELAMSIAYNRPSDLKDSWLTCFFKVGKLKPTKETFVE